MIVLDVNTDASKELTRKLSEVSRSAFPVAVRGALNNAAFDMKQNTMLKSAKDSFAERSPNFFKATSTVDMARGFKVSDMQAAVGFDEGKATRSGNKQAVKDLEQQEYGGKIEGRSFIPEDTARTGGGNKKMVRPANRLKQIKHIINADKGKGKTAKQRFIRAAFMARKLHGNNAYVLGNVWGDGRQTLSRIDNMQTRVGFHKDIKGAVNLGLGITRTALYTFKHGRHVSVKGKGFMARAANESGLKIDDYYVTQARKQFEKYLK